jgi:hypothetical protein
VVEQVEFGRNSQAGANRNKLQKRKIIMNGNGITIFFVFAPLFVACFVYAGFTNHVIGKLKKQIKDLNLKVAELQARAGISN